jgi:type I restriction-modification system DNA methylase subunit
MIAISHEAFIEKFAAIPFLNGGLFDCLDRRDTSEPQEYKDGFSRESKRAAFVPNCLFFGSANPVGDGAREGLIGIFSEYNFTIEENTPQDIEIALDPELLGKVFENLLGTYNEETAGTARNESGSFYTPREIVEYMVDASLKEYLNPEFV